MFLLDGKKLIWTAFDLTAAAECEYALLWTVDYRLQWAETPPLPRIPCRSNSQNWEIAMSSGY
jgi:hypothetical protein